MNQKLYNGHLLIEDLIISKKIKTVLQELNVKTVDDLYVMYLVETIPKIGTVIKHYPKKGKVLVYTAKINYSIKLLLQTLCEIKELDHVGVR